MASVCRPSATSPAAKFESSSAVPSPSRWCRAIMLAEALEEDQTNPHELKHIADYYKMPMMGHLR